MYTNEIRGTISLSASHDKYDHIVHVHPVKFLLPPEQDGWFFLTPVNGFWLFQTPKSPQVLSGRVFWGQTQNMPGMVLLVWMNSVLT